MTFPFTTKYPNKTADPHPSLTIRQVFRFPQASLALQQLQLPLHLDPMKHRLAKRELILAQSLNPLEVRVPSQPIPCKHRVRCNCAQS